jgi:hypothetical protein
MMIDNVVMNEYVHTDSVFRVGDQYNIIYEPTEEAFNKVHGTIYFEGGREWCW